MSHAAALWLSLALLLGNAFFVGAEFAVMTARRSQLEPMAAAGSRRAQVSLQALEQVASLLTCAQLGITVCSVGLGAVAETALHEMLHGPFERAGLPDAASNAVALVLALLIVAYLHVVVGEMVPKNLAIAGPDRAALALAPPLLYITRALGPLIRLMEGAAKGVVRLLRVEPKDAIASTFTAEEVQFIAAESHREGLIEERQHGRVLDALEFSDRVAGDLAVPLDRLIVLPYGASPADVEGRVAEHGYSRYPMLGDSSALVGYLHLKDTLHASEPDYDRPIPQIRIRRLPLVSADVEVEDVLSVMQRTGAHLAQVVAGGTVIGVVFLADVLDELVGENS
jgi:CBS domain containing-hemolysin-like protein